MKNGMSNKMVQHAIAQRQHHMLHLQQQQSQSPQAPPVDNYSVHPARHSVYNLPVASHTWDALNQPNRADDLRRQSWYGYLGSQAPQGAPIYQQNQMFGQHPGYFGNANTMHS